MELVVADSLNDARAGKGRELVINEIKADMDERMMAVCLNSNLPNGKYGPRLVLQEQLERLHKSLGGFPVTGLELVSTQRLKSAVASRRIERGDSETIQEALAAFIETSDVVGCLREPVRLAVATLGSKV